jgi:signal peptidase II
MEPWSYLSDTVRLQLVYNAGAFLGLGSSFPEAWRQGIFNIADLAIAAGVFIFATATLLQHQKER